MEPLAIHPDVEGVIGMACGETARYSECYASLMSLERPDKWGFLQCKSMSVAENFNKIARQFLRSNAQWLFLVNDDHVWAPSALMKLLAHDKDVVTGLYLSRTLPCAPVLFDRMDARGYAYQRYLNPGDSGLVPVKAAGDGCLLIKRKVIEAIADPWWELGNPEPDKCGHDVLFSRKVADAGFQMYCDLEVTVGHLSLFSVFPYRDEQGRWITLIANNGQNLAIPAAQCPANPYTMEEGA